MKHTLLFSLILIGAAPRALAQNDISFVSVANGSDSNPCTAAQPCYSFQHAHGVTNSGGTIKAMSAGLYTPVDITKPLTIDGSGVAVIVVSPGNTGSGQTIGIYVEFSSGGNVVIRDIAVHVGPDVDPIWGTGVSIEADTQLENVSVTGFATYGVFLNGNSSFLTAKNLVVSGDPTKGFTGIYMIAGGSASMRDSVITGWQFGLYVLSAGCSVVIERSEFSFNGTAVQASGTVRTSDSVITGNTLGILAINGGQIVSFRNNLLAGNTTDGATPFSVSLK
jgi:hypothetical protein